MPFIDLNRHFLHGFRAICIITPIRTLLSCISCMKFLKKMDWLLKRFRLMVPWQDSTGSLNIWASLLGVVQEWIVLCFLLQVYHCLLCRFVDVYRVVGCVQELLFTESPLTQKHRSHGFNRLMKIQFVEQMAIRGFSDESRFTLTYYDGRFLCYYSSDRYLPVCIIECHSVQTIGVIGRRVLTYHGQS